MTKHWTYKDNACFVEVTTHNRHALGGLQYQEKSVEVTINGRLWERRCASAVPMSVTPEEVALKVEADIDKRLASGQTMPTVQL